MKVYLDALSEPTNKIRSFVEPPPQPYDKTPKLAHASVKALGVFKVVHPMSRIYGPNLIEFSEPPVSLTRT